MGGSNRKYIYWHNYAYYPDINNIIDYFQDRKQTIIRITKITKEKHTHFYIITYIRAICILIIINRS